MKCSIIDISSGQRIEQGVLPIRVTLPPRTPDDIDDGVAEFTALGQEMPGHAPRFRCVEQVVIASAPSYPHIATGETRQYANGRDEISLTYAPDSSAFERAIEDRIERVARARGYASADRLAGYVNDPNQAWADEAQSFVNWRSGVWVYALTELAKVQGGQRSVSTLEALLAELPAAPWTVD